MNRTRVRHRNEILRDMLRTAARRGKARKGRTTVSVEGAHRFAWTFNGPVMGFEGIITVRENGDDVFVVDTERRAFVCLSDADHAGFERWRTVLGRLLPWLNSYDVFKISRTFGVDLPGINSETDWGLAMQYAEKATWMELDKYGRRWCMFDKFNTVAKKEMQDIYCAHMRDERTKSGARIEYSWHGKHWKRARVTDSATRAWRRILNMRRRAARPH